MEYGESTGTTFSHRPLIALDLKKIRLLGVDEIVTPEGHRYLIVMMDLLL